MISPVPFLSQLGVRDVRHLMYRADWTLGHMKAQPSSATLHCNGSEPVNVRSYKTELQHLVDLSYWHTSMGAFGLSSGGDGVMYHLAVTREGYILQLRDIDTALWHAGTAANRTSIAVLLPIGGAQLPSAAQWIAATNLFDALIRHYDWPNRYAILERDEWRADRLRPARLHNGVPLMLEAWRKLTPFHSSYRLRDVFCVPVHSAPTVAASVVTLLETRTEDGKPVLVEVDALVPDDTDKAGRACWARLKSGPGYIQLSQLEVHL